MRAPEHETVAEEAEAETEAGGLAGRGELHFYPPLTARGEGSGGEGCGGEGCLCCLCNKLARHWFIPKTRHTNCVGLRRDTPGSCRAHSPAVLGSLFNAVYAVYTVCAVYAVQKTTVSASAKTAREAGRGQ